ncbi:unnamed protein product, partial [Darwinula stevensoni]
MSRTPLTCMHHGPNNEEVDCVMDDEVNLKGYSDTCGDPLQANFTFAVSGLVPFHLRLHLAVEYQGHTEKPSETSGKSGSANPTDTLVQHTVIPPT